LSMTMTRANHAMQRTQPLALRVLRNRPLCFTWLGGLSLSR
jgi:hypothetical protein